MNTLDQKLIKACQNGNIYAIKKLLEKGADPNCCADERPWPTPLHIATKKGHIAIIRLLIQYGADPTITDSYERNILHYAVLHRHHEITQYLITELKLDPNVQDDDGTTPLMIAAFNGDIDLLKRLIDLGANPHATNYDGRTALHYAVEKSNHLITEYLITQFKLDPNTPDQRNITPFIIAAQNGDIDMLKHLIQFGANPYTTDEDGQTALHHALTLYQYDIYDIIEYLITTLQLDPNAQDRWGQTSFLIAVKNDNINILRTLIRLGANPYVTNKNNRTALHYAVENRNRMIAQYLITQLNFDPNAQDQEGITPLIIAIKNNDIKMLNHLIQLGANPFMIDDSGQNLLHYAVRYNKLKIASFLIKYLHINPNSQDHHGITPLIIAVKYGYSDMIPLLTQLGANPNIPNHKGEPPSFIASQNRIRLPKPQPSTITL